MRIIESLNFELLRCMHEVRAPLNLSFPGVIVTDSQNSPSQPIHFVMQALRIDVEELEPMVTLSCRGVSGDELFGTPCRFPLALVYF